MAFSLPHPSHKLSWQDLGHPNALYKPKGRGVIPSPLPSPRLGTLSTHTLLETREELCMGRAISWCCACPCCPPHTHTHTRVPCQSHAKGSKADATTHGPYTLGMSLCLLHHGCAAPSTGKTCSLGILQATVMQIIKLYSSTLCSILSLRQHLPLPLNLNRTEPASQSWLLVVTMTLAINNN